MNFHKFLKGLEPNANGHLIKDIWGFSDREINANHDFIQTLFPWMSPVIGVSTNCILKILRRLRRLDLIL